MARLLLRLLPRLLAAGVPLLLGACASIAPPLAGTNPVDPYERFNRHIFVFNERLDHAVVAPVAHGYVAIMPRPARDCIGNAFANLGEIGNFVNATLQGRPRDMGIDAGRFAVNSTAGLLGCIDVARRWGWERNRQDFGLTLGKWGVPDGPYFVLPFLGPRSLRDAIGEIPDHFTDPATYVTPVADAYATDVLYFIDRRAQLFDGSALIEEAALDHYAFLRDAYLQRRRNRVWDGNPPPLPEDEDPGDSPPPAKPEPKPPTEGTP
jgi:phospholipid-binding lipoprotein MlaA